MSQAKVELLDKTQVLHTLEPLEKSRLKKVEHNSGAKVTFADDTASIRTSRAAKPIEFSPEGYQNFLNFAGIPQPMARVLTPDTKNKVANEILARKDQYAVVVSDNRITSLAKPNQISNAVNSERLLRTIEKAGRGVQYVKAMIVNGNQARLELITERNEEVVKGDMMAAGAVVQFSPLGIEYPTVESYILRWWCGNGATSNDCLRKFGHGEGDDVWHFFQNAVKEAIRSVVKIRRRFQQMIEENIPAAERAMVLEAMIKEARLPNDIAQAIRTRAIEEPPRNAYDIMNMITYASSHDLKEPRQVIRAQIAAAKFADEKEHAMICPACRKNR